MPAVQETVEQVRRIDVDQYKYGFETLIESEKAPKGLSEDTVRFISAKKNEPDWMLAWRLDAYRRWLTMREPKWAKVQYGPIDYQNIYYYSAPKKAPQSLDEIDPEILRTYEKLGIPTARARGVAGYPEAGGGERRGRGRGRRGRQWLQQGCRRRGVRFRFGCHHFPGGTGQGRRAVSCRSRRRCMSIPNW